MTIQAANGVSAQGPLVLIVRDGWRVVDEDPDTARRHGNGVLLARLPVLEHGRFGGLAFRVPTPTVSVIDFTAVLDRDVTKDEINATMREYSEDMMHGILGYTEEPLVSMDLKGDSRSSIFSGPGHARRRQLVRQRVRLRLHRLTAFVAERLPVVAGVGAGARA